jgi:hypothetical protein
VKLPVDTSAIAFLCALEPQPVLAFDTKQPRADENGEPLYVVQLIALAEGEAEILAVKVPGMPSGIRQGHPVKVSGLVAQPWSMNDRSGVAFRATRIEPAVPARQGELRKGGGAQERVREGTGAAANEPRSPPPTKVGCSQHPAAASGMEPMMPNDPTRRSALSVALLAHANSGYEVDC